jgi:DNA repair exonuclease SbcCD ATPase subunit
VKVSGKKGKGGKGETSGLGSTAAPDLDALYQLPLAEFTAARNALAARMKKAGGDVDAVKSLPKPSVSAWAVNQLFWRHRPQLDRLLAAGDRFRDAQAAQLAGKSADLREPIEARREALSELTRLAAALLQEGGSAASPDMMRRVTTTLEALAVYGRHAGAPPAGRLHDDVDPPGFEALSALVPRVGTSGKTEGPSRVLTFRQEPPKPPKKKLDPETAAREQEQERKAAAAAARTAVQDAERALRDARREMQTAETALKKVAARTKQAEQDKAEAEARLERAAAAAEEARQEARRVAADAETAAQSVEDAERALARARNALKNIGDS